MNSPKTLNDVVKGNSALRRMAELIRQLNPIKAAVLENVPKNYTEHCIFINIKNHSLLLYVDSPAWASRFRYLSPDLLRVLKKSNNFQNLTSISVKIMANLPATYFNKTHYKKANISQENIELLEQSVQTHTAEIQEKLINLINTLKKTEST